MHMVNHNSVSLTDSSLVIALQGSPRRNGNTAVLLNRTLETARRRGVASEAVVLRDHNISPCLEIGQCMKTGDCAIQDDMTDLYDRLTRARVVIVASPVFFYGFSGMLKSAIDRCQALWARKYVLKRDAGPGGMGVVISVGATKGKKLFDGILLTARYFFDVLNIETRGELLVRGMDEAGIVEKNIDVLAEAEKLGDKIADYILSLND